MIEKRSSLLEEKIIVVAIANEQRIKKIKSLFRK
jgi:hypothetical protein